MMYRKSLRLMLLLGLVWIPVACGTGPDSAFTDTQPLVFPFEGQLGQAAPGSTVAMVVDSNYIETCCVSFDSSEQHGLHIDRVQVLVSDPGGSGWTDSPADVRYVIPLQAPSNTIAGKNRPGATTTVVVFDMPQASDLNSPTQFPFTVELKLMVDGQQLYEPRFIVTGDQGQRNPLIDATSIAENQLARELAPRPMIRLRGKRGLGKFESTQPPIASMEFVFLWNRTCINQVDAFPATEAINGTAIVGPKAAISNSDFDFARVALVDPKGFSLNYQSEVAGTGNADESLAGTGPFLDLAFDLVPGSTCDLGDVSNFAVYGLKASDPGGTPFVDVPTAILDTPADPSANATLRMYPVTVPAPVGGGGGC